MTKAIITRRRLHLWQRLRDFSASGYEMTYSTLIYELRLIICGYQCESVDKFLNPPYYSSFLGRIEYQPFFPVDPADFIGREAQPDIGIGLNVERRMGGHFDRVIANFNGQ